jgi:hypothetical protein
MIVLYLPNRKWEGANETLWYGICRKAIAVTIRQTTIIAIRTARPDDNRRV